MNATLSAILAKFALTGENSANLAALAAVPDLDLIRLETELLTGFDARRAAGGSDVIVALREFADAASAVRAERDARPAREAAIAELAQSLARPAVPAPQASLAALGASIPAASQPAPRIDNVKPRWELVGTREQGDLKAVAAAMIEANESFGGEYFGPERKIKVGRLTREFPEERTLDLKNERAIEEKLAAVLDRAYDADKWTESLVASGGFCAPPAPQYDLAQISGAQRPVWDGYLPLFRADRGGILFMTPPALSSIVVSGAQAAGAAVSVWTNTVDTTPGGTTKPKQTLACPAQNTVTLQAVVTNVQIGNFASRAFPELVSQFTANVLAAHAREAETLNLSDIDAASTQATVTKLLGALPDLVMSVRQAAARYRNFQRMPHDAQLRLMIPAWVIDLLAADVSQRHAGDGLDIFTVTEAQIRSIFAAANVNVTFYEDAGANATQQLGAQGATDIRNWPLTVAWYIFHEGAFLGLDGGTLDIGLYRDSTLNGTNDYRIFSESWEKVAFRGLESVRFVQTICPTGEGVLDHAALACAAS